MKTTLQRQLAAVAPHIAIDTLWSRDDDAEVQPGIQAWQSEVRASIIVNGALVSASTYLANTLEKEGDHPSKSNPDISGYEPQMTFEVLERLAETVGRARVNAALDAIFLGAIERNDDAYSALMDGKTHL